MKREPTEQEEKELQETLTNDILERYDHPEYHDPSIVEAFCNKLEDDPCESCKKCGETICGNDTESHACYEAL